MSTYWGPLTGTNGGFQVGIEVPANKTSTYSSYSMTVTAKGLFRSSKGVSDTNNTVIVSGTMGSFNGSKNIYLPYGGGTQVLDQRSVTLTASWDGPVSCTYGISATGIENFGSGYKATVPGRTVTVSRRPTGKPTVPRSPVVESITGSSAVVKFTQPADWQGPSSGRRYWMHVSSRSDFSNTLWSGNASSGQKVTGLPAATRIYVRVRAEGVWWDGTKFGPFLEFAFTTGAGAPVLAGTPAARNVARTSFVIPTATVSNNGGQAPTRYRAQVNTSASASGATVHEVGSWSAITVGQRSPLTEYFYRVSAYNSGGWGPWTTTWASVTTLDAVPSNPEPPNVKDITETTCIISWLPPTLNGATLEGYMVRVCLGDDPESYVWTHTAPPGTPGPPQVTGLSPVTVYRAFLKYLASPSDSGWSEPTLFRTAGVQQDLFPHIKVEGRWRPFETWVKRNGVWERVAHAKRIAGRWYVDWIIRTGAVGVPLALDTDGVPYHGKGDQPVQLHQDTDGTPYYVLGSAGGLAVVDEDGRLYFIPA